jgi:hypothetical protein
MYFAVCRNMAFSLAALVVISCDRASATRTATGRDDSVSSQVAVNRGNPQSTHSLGTPLDSTDFIVTGLIEGADSATVVARLGRPDSVSTEKNQYDAGAKLSTLHYRALEVGFVLGTVQSFEILDLGISTARGIRVGSTLDEIKAAYGKPGSQYEGDWIYLDPNQDLHQIYFTVRAGQVSKIFVGTGLD